MTINQNPSANRTRYINGVLHKESYIRDIPGYNKGTYSRKCECGEDTTSMFIYVSTDPDKESPVHRVEKYEEQVEMLMEPLFPEPLLLNEIKAASVPFSFTSSSVCRYKSQPY